MLLLAVSIVPDQRQKSAGVSILAPSGLMRRRANSIAARIKVALASPTPANCGQVVSLNSSPFSSMTRTSFPASVITSISLVPFPVARRVTPDR